MKVKVFTSLEKNLLQLLRIYLKIFSALVILPLIAMKMRQKEKFLSENAILRLLIRFQFSELFFCRSGDHLSGGDYLVWKEKAERVNVETRNGKVLGKHEQWNKKVFDLSSWGQWRWSCRWNIGWERRQALSNVTYR